MCPISPMQGRGHLHSMYSMRFAVLDPFTAVGHTHDTMRRGCGYQQFKDKLSALRTEGTRSTHLPQSTRRSSLTVASTHLHILRILYMLPIACPARYAVVPFCAAHYNACTGTFGGLPRNPTCHATRTPWCMSFILLPIKMSLCVGCIALQRVPPVCGLCCIWTARPCTTLLWHMCVSGPAANC